MVKLRVAYCEDEIIQIKYMEKILENWANKNKIQYSFSGFSSGKEFLFETEENYPFEVIFLDIDMDEIDGMKLARKIRENDSKLPIIFLTNRKEYVFEGYEVNAYRYLLKPMNENKITEVFDQIIKLYEKEKKYIIEKQGGQFVKIPLEDIIYLEANGHYITINTEKGIITVKKSLQDEINSICLDGQTLFENGFISTHRSFLVNIKYIERVSKTECIIHNNKSVPISRNMYKEVNEAFIKYYREI